MLFYEFFRMHLNQDLLVELKNGMVLEGRLLGVDPFHNLKLKDASFKTAHPFLTKLTDCSIRGSSLKTVRLRIESKLKDSLVDATRIRAFFKR